MPSIANVLAAFVSIVGFVMVLGDAPALGAGLIGLSVLLVAHQPTAETLWGWVFLLAIITVMGSALEVALQPR